MRNIAPSLLRQPIDGVGFGAFVRAKAQLDVAPGRANAVRAELGLPDEARWKSVEAAWLRRVDDEPPVRRAYHLCYAQEVEALRGQAPQVEAPAEVMAPAAPALELPSFMKQEQRATPEPSTDETAMLPAIAFGDEVGLPFQPAAAPAPPSPAVRPSQLEAFSAVTAPLDFERLRNDLVRGPTPFKGATTPERLAELKQETASSDALRRPPGGVPDDVPDADETAMYVPTPSERAALQTLPFEPAGNDEVPELTVVRYAMLAAELSMKMPTPEILDRYGVGSPAVLVALSAAFERRFDEDPARWAQFEERKAHFRSFMKPLR